MVNGDFPPLNALAIGPDKAWFEGEDLVILARRPIPDWRIREHQRVAIYFKERKYFLRDKKPARRPYAVRYELLPWPADAHEQSSRFITYDEEYVAHREAAHRIGMNREFAYQGLLLLYPFLGFLWSGFKNRVLVDCGFVPASITNASVFLAFSFCVLEGVFVGWLHGGLLMVLLGSSQLIWLDYLLLLAVSVDCAVRYSQLLGGETDKCYGFLEWLWPGKKRD